MDPADLARDGEDFFRRNKKSALINEHSLKQFMAVGAHGTNWDG